MNPPLAQGPCANGHAQPWPEQSFASALATALLHTDLTLDRLAVRLAQAGVPVSVATLSYWQTGRSTPVRSKSLEAVVELEKILALAPGTLTRCMRRPPERAWKAREVLVPSATIEDVLDSMGLDLDCRTLAVSAHEHISVVPAIDPLTGNEIEGMVHSRTLIRQILSVQKAGVESIPYIVQSADPRAPVVNPLVGCSVGQHFEDDPRGLAIGELVFGRSLDPAQLIRIEHEVDWGVGPITTNWTGRALPNQVRQLLLTATFSGRVPRWATLTMGERFGGTPLFERELPVEDHQVQAIITDAQPGVYWITWEPDPA